MTTAPERTRELYDALGNIGITMPPDRYVEKWLGRGVTDDDIEHVIGRARERMGDGDFTPHTRWMDTLLAEFEAIRVAGKQPPYEAERTTATEKATRFADPERTLPVDDRVPGGEALCAHCELTERSDADATDRRWAHRPDNPGGHAFEAR